MNGSAPLGRLFGVPLRVHWSAPLLILLLSNGLSGRTLPAWAPGHSTGVYTAAGVLGAALLMASLLAHEAAHAVVARRAGITVEDVTVWGLGGVTRMGRAGTPGAQFAVSAAGPLTSLVLGGLGLAAGVGAHGAHAAVLSAVLFWTGWANLLLGAFNLLPAAPLDGGRILQAAVWRWRGDRQTADRVAGACGRVAGALLVFGGWYQLLHGSTAGLWLIVVGFFVSAAAGAEIRRAALENALRGVPLTEAMSSPVVTAPDWLTAERLVEELPATGGHSVLPLVDFDGRVSGVLAVRRLSAVPAARRGQVRLRELAVPLARCLVAAPGDSLVETLGRAGATLPLLVLDGGRPLGIVTADDLARLVRNPRTTHGAPGPSPTAP